MYKSAIVGFSYLTGLFCASLFSIAEAYIIGGVLALFGVVLLLLRHKYAALSSFVMGAGFAVMALFVQLCYTPVVSANGSERLITGSFIEKSYSASDTACFILETEINGANTRISVFGEDVEAEYGDTVSLNARLSSFGSADYAIKALNLSDGIFLKGFALSDITVEKSGAISPVKLVYSYRNYLLERLNVALNGDTGALVSAMFFGERSYLTDTQKNEIRACGLSHMTAVSGLHLSVIMTLFMAVLDAFFPNRKLLRFLTITVAALSFTVLFGFSLSVMRASFMFILYYSARLFGRRSDPLNSVGMALFAIILVSPFAAYDCGLMLSVAGTIGAGWLGGKVNKRLHIRDDNILKTYKRRSDRIKAYFMSSSYYPEQPYLRERLTDKTRVKTPLRDSIISAACALLCVTPLSAVYFGGISLWSVLCGLIIQPFFTVCLGAMVLFTLTGGVSGLFLLAAGICGRIMSAVISLFGGLDFGWIDLSGGFVPPLMLLSALYLAFFFVRIRNGKARICSVIVAVATCAVIIAAMNAYLRTVSEMDIITDGEGGAAVVSDDGKCTVIVTDDGRETAGKIYLHLSQKHVRKISCLDLTRLNSGICGYAECFKDFDIDVILLSESAARENVRYNFFPNATTLAENDTVIIADSKLSVKDKTTYMTLRGTLVSVSETNEGDYRGGIAVMDGYTKNPDVVAAINVFTDKRQKNLSDFGVNAYETDVRFFFKENGLVAEEYK